MKVLLGTALWTILAVASLDAQLGPYQYYSISPCRVVDTRGANSTNGGPVFLGNTQRDFRIRGNCGVPSTAKAVTINVTVTQASLPSWLAVWPSGTPRPWVSTMSFDPSAPALANGAIVGISANTNDLSVYNSEGSVHVILDITGYFQ